MHRFVAPRPGPQLGRVQRRLLQVGAVLTALALGWTLVIGSWLPGFAQPRVEAAASEALGAPFVLERLEIAPWALQVGVFGLRLGPPDAPWLRVAEVHADLSIESLWRLAPVLERLQLRRPEIDLERLAPGRFNVTPLLEALRRRPPPAPDAEPARFALYNIEVVDGRLRFVDRPTGSEHRVEALQLGVPFVSNLAAHVAVDVEPALAAQVNGSPLQLKGKTQPFSDGQRSTLALDWQNIELTHWFEALAPLLPQPLPLALQRGRLDLALQLAFESHPAPAPPTLNVFGDIVLSQLQLAAPDRGLQLGVERLAVQGLELQPLARRAVVGTVRLQTPAAEIDLARLQAAPARPDAATDRLRLDAAVAAASSPAASAPVAAGAEPAWQWRVDQVELADGRLLLREPAWPEGQLLAPLTLKLGGLDSRADAAPATLAVAGADARGAQLRIDGTLAFATRRADLRAELSALQPQPWLIPWQALLPVALIEGRLAVQALAALDETGVAVSDGAVQLEGLQLRPAQAAARSGLAPDRLSLRRLEIGGVALRLATGQAQSAEVASVLLDGLDVRAQRGEGGQLGWLPPAPTGAAPTAAAGDNTTAPRWRIAELRCRGCAVSLSDRSVTPPVALGLARTDLTLRSLGSDLGQPLAFELAAQALGGGSLRGSGTLRPEPLALRSRLDIRALDLRALQSYLEPHVNLALASAKASVVGELNVDGSAQQPLGALRWRGSLGLSELRALDRLNDAEFVRFKTLRLDDARLDWRPAALQADLGQVSLDDFYGRVIVSADGRINLQDVLRRAGDEGRSLTTPEGSATAAPPATTEAVAAPVPAASAASAPAAAAPPPQLRWRGIRLAGGSIDFTDNFIRPNYSARLTDVAGEVAALAWDDPQPAAVRISGKVDGSAPLEIGGSVHPLGPRLATDITASARGVDITRLTAYSARYAGYGIEKGTLSVKVRYKVVDGKLEAENNLYLDQLTFGDKVDSPSALKLPVLLAVALLKDRNGVIDIDLPISGSLDDPQFSIGGIVVRVIVNLITKAITAPFALLASAFGGGQQELGYVEFAPGASELSEASRQRLDALAKALDARPALKLEATGRADPALDEAALRGQHLDRLMRSAKAKASGELPDSVKIEPAERARWLEAAYKAADLKAKPRNLIGLAKSLPPAEMEALLLASAPAGEAPLRALADQRGDRVKAYLVAKVAPERVLLTASKLGGEGIEDKGATTRVAFSLK